MEMATGNIGGIPNSTERSSGATKPTARPQGPPSTKPHSRMGKCMGQSMLPTWGTWPVIMGSTKASARNRAASTMPRVAEVLVFMVIPPEVTQKRGLPRHTCQRQTPSWRLLQKVWENELQRAGFCPRVRLPAGNCEKYSRDSRLLSSEAAKCPKSRAFPTDFAR